MSGLFWGGILLALVVVQILVIWSIRRHRDPSLKIDCDYPIDKLMPSLAGLTLGTAVIGNKVEVHENGAFFDVLIERIRAARYSVHFETFLWKDGQLGRRVADALIDRARAGVQVRVLLDGQGSKEAGKDTQKETHKDTSKDTAKEPAKTSPEKSPPPAKAENKS